MIKNIKDNIKVKSTKIAHKIKTEHLIYISHYYPNQELVL